MLTVVVCEDSVPVSQLLVELINADPGLHVVGVAGNGREVIELNRKLRPNVITMDVRMPVLNGLEATRQIMAEQPTPIVLVSDIAEVDINLSMDALNAGALAVLPKPHGPGHPDFKADGDRLRHTLHLMSSVKLVRRWMTTGPLTIPPKPSATPSPRSDIYTSPVQPRLVAIGSSTGGPSAIATILSNLPPTFNLPILVTQHIMPGFGTGLARWLNDTTGRRVVTATEGMVIEPSSSITVIAPDHCHMILTPARQIAFDHRGLVNGVLPSVDVLFESVAHSLGPLAVGVLLTGMGRDGAQGLSKMRQAGSFTIAQDEASSVVFGMPKEAIALGAAWKIAPLEKIASELVAIVGPSNMGTIRRPNNSK
ncbi:MAG: chemotaxis-specific protein-glutamate methyltransferase CheB [Chloroflexi bacterium]|nr:chemotaxis-specific protein-glutamate methyltransferase CheB [Chloroflexota bacterium]